MTPVDRQPVNRQAVIERFVAGKPTDVMDLRESAEWLAGRVRDLEAALRERDYALRRIATTGAEVADPAEWMRGIARAALAPAEEPDACWCSEDGITPKRGHADDHILGTPQQHGFPAAPAEER